MIVKTKAIVLSYIKYGENSIIVRTFTEEKGFDSFMINSVRSQRSKKTVGHFQPFTLLDIVAYIKENRGIQRLSEHKNYCPHQSIHQNFTKSSITLFLVEILSQILQNEEKNEPLFSFLEQSIRALDKITRAENFHLQFLLKLSEYLGYAISNFESIYTSMEKETPTEDSGLLVNLLSSEYGADIPMNKLVRNELIDDIISYYHHHAHLPKPKSLEVLRKVLS